MATLFQTIQFFDDAGNVLSLGHVYWYQAGTSTPLQTWQDQGETTPNAAMITLDGDGRPPGGGIFIRGSYKLVIKDYLDNTIDTIDHINQYDQIDFTGLTATISDLNSTTTITVAVSGPYTVTTANRGETLLVNAASAPIAVNLPAAAIAGNKFIVTIKKIDNSANVVTIVPNGAELIDGYSGYTLYDYNDFVTLHCDASSWKSVAAESRGTIVTQSISKTLDLGDQGKMFNCDASSGALTMNLPSVITVGRGYTVSFKKVDTGSNTVTIVAALTQTIDRSPNYILNTTEQFITIKSDGANWFLLAELSTGENFSLLPKISGLLLSNNVGSPLTKVDFAPGYFIDSGLNNIFHLSTTLTKDLTGVWVAGNNNGGGHGAGALANDTWYHAFVIAKADGTVDAGFDTSLTATNLLTAAPGYVYYFRVSSIKTKGTVPGPAATTIEPFTMSYTGMGRLVQWSPVIDQADITGTGGVYVDHPVVSPLGLRLMAYLSYEIGDNQTIAEEGIFAYIISKNISSTNNAILLHSHTFAGSVSTFVNSVFFIQTDTASTIQIKITSTDGSASPVLTRRNLGWLEND